MPLIDIEILQPFCAQAMEGTKLTPAERGEVLRIAQGFACKDAAQAAGISPETIRARRKRIYRKLDVAGSNEVISSLLARAVKMLARGERLQPMTTAGASAATPAPSGEVRASSVG
jgi:DNA-binding CsgD family transcriptional regulator